MDLSLKYEQIPLRASYWSLISAASFRSHAATKIPSIPENSKNDLGGQTVTPYATLLPSRLIDFDVAFNTL